MTVEILGKEYPVAYTIFAENKICEKLGTIENLGEMMDKGAAEAIDSVAYILACLVSGGVQRQKVMCNMAGEEYSGPEAVSYETIIAAMEPSDIFDKQKIIFEAIKKGSETKVKLKSEKNTKATLSK